MSLAEKVKQGAPRKQRGPQCATCVIVQSLPDTERDALLGMLVPDSGWTAKAIHAALVDEGLDAPGFKSIERHRRGDCEPLVPSGDRTPAAPTPPRNRRSR